MKTHLLGPLVALCLLALMILVAGCSTGTYSGYGFNPAVLEGQWQGWLNEDGGGSLALLDAQFDAQGNVIAGGLSGGSNNGDLLSGSVNDDGHGFIMVFEDGGQLVASSITIDGNTITGAGTLTLPSGGGVHRVSFELKRNVGD